jgi:predicted DNA-binding transcriptional regulator YafY
VSRSENAIRLLHLLQTKKKAKVEDLAEWLGVNRRSVFRYLKDLQEGGVQIFWSAEEGYFLPKGVSIPALEFSEKELTTILVGTEFLKSLNDATLSGAAATLQKRLIGQLPPGARSHFDDVVDAFIVNPNQRTRKSESDSRWHLMLTAILEGREVCFEYKVAGKDRMEERTVRPAKLLFYFDHWNLVGYDVNRRDLRSFVLDKMGKVSFTGVVYLERFTKENVLNRSGDNSFVCKLCVQDGVVDRFLQAFTTPIVSRETIDGETVITFLFENESYLNTWLLQFGSGVRIISPARLIEGRKVLLQRLLDETKKQH